MSKLSILVFLASGIISDITVCSISDLSISHRPIANALSSAALESEEAEMREVTAAVLITASLIMSEAYLKLTSSFASAVMNSGLGRGSMEMGSEFSSRVEFVVYNCFFKSSA